MYSPPKVVRTLFSEFIWQSRSDKLLLTFDDGPQPETTPEILDRLDEYDVKGLFFFIGDNVKKYPELAQETKQRGHVLGNHSQRHKNMMWTGSKDMRKEIGDAVETFAEYGLDTPWFRPPYGKFNPALKGALRDFGLTCVMWSLLTHDFKEDFQLVKLSIDQYLKEGSIIVMHDNPNSKNVIIETLDYVVEKADEMGLLFGDTEQCLK
jgi:peptidoglycan/xylan/chitin deacetylase (PgdA/CDA1 family)